MHVRPMSPKSQKYCENVKFCGDESAAQIVSDFWPRSASNSQHSSTYTKSAISIMIQRMTTAITTATVIPMVCAAAGILFCTDSFKYGFLPCQFRSRTTWMGWIWNATFCSRMSYKSVAPKSPLLSREEFELHILQLPLSLFHFV